MSDVRLNRARAQADLLVDVLSAWRGRYEDDDRHADIRWITTVIPETERSESPWYKAGWLCRNGTQIPALGWKLTSNFQLASLDRSFIGVPFQGITRGQFRKAARSNGVSLPACHATLYLIEARRLCPTGPECDMHPFEHAYKWKCRRCGKVYEAKRPCET